MDANLDDDSLDWERVGNSIAQLLDCDDDDPLDVCEEVDELLPTPPIEQTLHKNSEHLPQQVFVNPMPLPTTSNVEKVHFGNSSHQYYRQQEVLPIEPNLSTNNSNSEHLPLQVPINPIVDQTISDLENILDLINSSFQYYRTQEQLHIEQKMTTNSYNSAHLPPQIIVNPMADPTTFDLQKSLDHVKINLEYSRRQTQIDDDSFTQMKIYEEYLKIVLGIVATSVFCSFKQITQCVSSGCFIEFQELKLKIRSHLLLLEERTPISHLYEETLTQCLNMYIKERNRLVIVVVSSRLDALLTCNMINREINLCSLLKAACAFFMNISIDEFNLFRRFFGTNHEMFLMFLEAICIRLYTMSKPFIDLVNKLPELIDLSIVLKLEILQESLQANREAVGPFRSVVDILARDVKIRLFNYVQNYFIIDVGQFKPSYEDLAYPEKLQLVEGINILRLPEAKESPENSLTAIGLLGSVTSQEIVRIHNPPVYRPSTSDTLALCYTPVRKALHCLSLVYGNVCNKTFNQMSQHAVIICRESLKKAAKHISKEKCKLNGHMFEIRHLLVLREHLAPFLIDIIKEEKQYINCSEFQGKKLLTQQQMELLLSSKMELIEFLLNGPEDLKREWLVGNTWLETQKNLDAGINEALEALLIEVTNQLIPGFLKFTKMAETWYNERSFKSMIWAKIKPLSGIIVKGLTSIKKKLPMVRLTINIYITDEQCRLLLNNKIKSTVVNAFERFRGILCKHGYTEWEQTCIMQQSDGLQILFAED